MLPQYFRGWFQHMTSSTRVGRASEQALLTDGLASQRVLPPGPASRTDRAFGLHWRYFRVSQKAPRWVGLANWHPGRRLAGNDHYTI